MKNKIKPIKIAKIECPLCGMKGAVEYEFPAKLEDCFKEKWHDCKLSITSKAK